MIEVVKVVFSRQKTGRMIISPLNDMPGNPGYRKSCSSGHFDILVINALNLVKVQLNEHYFWIIPRLAEDGRSLPVKNVVCPHLLLHLLLGS